MPRELRFYTADQACYCLLQYMDKTTSILLGRPQAIQEFHCDTLPPSDVDLDTMPRAARPHAPRINKPPTPPGVFTFVAIRHEMARLTGRIVEHFQNLSSPRQYSSVIQLDQDLQNFIAELPSPYRTEAMGNSDRSFDEICPYVPLHRCEFLLAS